MKLKLKLRLPLIILVTTIMIILVALFIKAFYVTTLLGQKQVDALLYALTYFSLSSIITLLYVAIDSKKKKIVSSFILLSITIYLGVNLVSVYYKYIDTIINKLVYLSSMKLIDIVNINIKDIAFINFASLLIIILNAMVVIVLISKPVIKQIKVIIREIKVKIENTSKQIINNISIGFLYKRIP